MEFEDVTIFLALETGSSAPQSCDAIPPQEGSVKRADRRRSNLLQSQALVELLTQAYSTCDVRLGLHSAHAAARSSTLAERPAIMEPVKGALVTQNILKSYLMQIFARITGAEDVCAMRLSVAAVQVLCHI
jgi:hypothetical protein